MSGARRFDAREQTLALTRALAAGIQPAVQDPAIPVDGYTFGVATMTENSPHDGEMHPDGDEVLYLVSGHVRVTVECEPAEVLEMHPGDGVVVPQGIWHKVDILEPSQIVYLTPGPGGEYRPLPGND